MTATIPPRLLVLTPAQRKVLGELTRDGAGNRAIAARLGISEDTVKAHLRAIFAAFGHTGANRAAVVVDCLRGRVRVRVQNNTGRRAATDLQETA